MKLYIQEKTREYGVDIVQNFSLDEYTAQIQNGIFNIISDIESAFYVMCEGKLKNEWPEDVTRLFNLIRHKMLDKAGEVARISENLISEEEMEKINSKDEFWQTIGDTMKRRE